MEEKERYYIELNMIIDEEKIINGEQNVTVCDIDDPDRAVDLLNQQDKEIKKLRAENQQLKQSQKQLAVEELEKIKDVMSKEAHYSEELTFVEYLYENYLDKQIKSLKGEE